LTDAGPPVFIGRPALELRVNILLLAMVLVRPESRAGSAASRVKPAPSPWASYLRIVKFLVRWRTPRA